MAKRNKKRGKTKLPKAKPKADKPLKKGLRKPNKKGDKDEAKAERIERYDKAFLISLGLIAVLTPLIFIPLLGWLLAITLVPYLACNIGCRRVRRSNGVQIGFLIGFLWSIIEVYLLFYFLTFIKISLTEPGISNVTDMIIIVTFFIVNIIFSMIGGYTGGAKFDLKEVKKSSTVDTKA